MTLPSVVSDLLMLAPSLSLAPRAPVLSARSLPAKSTRLTLLTCTQRHSRSHRTTDRRTLDAHSWGLTSAFRRPVWARERCRISPPRFPAECCNRQLNQGSFVLGCLLFLICIEFLYLYFPVLFCLSVSVKWSAAKIASEMTYIVSGGALNSTPTNHPTAFRPPKLGSRGCGVTHSSQLCGLVA